MSTKDKKKSKEDDKEKDKKKDKDDDKKKKDSEKKDNDKEKDKKKSKDDDKKKKDSDKKDSKKKDIPSTISKKKEYYIVQKIDEQGTITFCGVAEHVEHARKYCHGKSKGYTARMSFNSTPTNYLVVHDSDTGCMVIHSYLEKDESGKEIKFKDTVIEYRIYKAPLIDGSIY
jgi:hypothetical protein